MTEFNMSIRKKYNDTIHSITISNYFGSYSNIFKPTISSAIYLSTETLDSYNQFLSSSVRFEGPYPLAVRVIDGSRFIIERPPMQIKVDYSPTASSRSRRPIKPVTIWIPWIVVIVDVDDLNSTRIFFNDSPIQSLEDQVILPWTSNVYGDGRVCWGSSLYSLSSNFSEFDLYSWFNNAINEYFFGGWNSDLFPYNFTEFCNIAPEYFPPSYTPSDLDHAAVVTDFSSEILAKIKAKKFKFHNSNYHSFKPANIYYNFSFLDLNQTLDFAKKVKEQRANKTFRLSDILHSNKKNYTFSYYNQVYSSSNVLKNPLPIQVVVNTNYNKIYEEAINYLNNNNSESYYVYSSSVISRAYSAQINKLCQNENVEFILQQIPSTIHYLSILNYSSAIDKHAELILDEAVSKLSNGHSILHYSINEDIIPTVEQVFDFLSKKYEMV